MTTEGFFIESLCDHEPTLGHPPGSSMPAIQQHQCEECATSFSTHKALQTHMRRKHGVRCLQRFFVDNEGLCPVCGILFHSRLRCLAHLCDSRRTMCWSQILASPSNYQKLSFERLALDETDRILKREAYRAGHSHVIACKTAATAQGKQTGHVRT